MKAALARGGCSGEWAYELKAPHGEPLPEVPINTPIHHRWWHVTRFADASSSVRQCVDDATHPAEIKPYSSKMEVNQ